MARIKSGELFKSFDKFNNALTAYEEQNGEKFKRVNSKTLTNCYLNNVKRDLVNEGYKERLKYFEITFKCPLGIQKGIKTSDKNSACPVELRVAAHDDKRHLIIRKFIGAHNHEMHPTAKGSYVQNSESPSGSQIAEDGGNSPKSQSPLSSDPTINAIVKKLSKHLTKSPSDTLPDKLKRLKTLIKGWKKGRSMSVHEMFHGDSSCFLEPTDPGDKNAPVSGHVDGKNPDIEESYVATNQIIGAGDNSSIQSSENIEDALKVMFHSPTPSPSKKSDGENPAKRRKTGVMPNSRNREVSDEASNHLGDEIAFDSEHLELTDDPTSAENNESQEFPDVDATISKTIKPSGSLSDDEKSEPVATALSQKIPRDSARLSRARSSTIGKQSNLANKTCGENEGLESGSSRERLRRQCKTTTASELAKKKKEPLRFAQKSEIAQAREMLRWLKIADNTLEDTLQRRSKIRKDDLNYDAHNLRDSFLDSDVKIEILEQYFERVAFRDLKKKLNEKIAIKKKSEMSTCDICRKEIEGKAILCEGCLAWFDYKCVSIKRAPGKHKDWFCEACVKST